MPLDRSEARGKSATEWQRLNSPKRDQVHPEFGTAAGTALVDTDLGEGYIKALGNPEVPHILACELVGSLLADWLGLPTLDFALIEITADDEIPLLSGGNATVGPAFISTAEPTGYPWGGSVTELESVHNRLDISGLVVLDTWVLNCDRYAPQGRRVNLDNVLLVQYLWKPEERAAESY